MNKANCIYRFSSVRRIMILGFILLFAGKTSGQMTYLGLSGVSNVRTAQAVLQSSGAYWPATQIVDNYMYVCTSTGIYRKDLNSLSDTLWSLYAFPGIPIRDFVKHNDSVLAATCLIDDSLLLFSVDDGVSYVNRTSSHFFTYETANTVWRIAMNPLNPDCIVVLQNAYGVSRSEDFGNTWTSMSLNAGGYQERFIGINPNDTNNILYTGEVMTFDSYTRASYDHGATWAVTESIINHCTHLVAFHPANANVLLSGGEGRISKSTDEGLTWIATASIPLYITSIVYDQSNSNIVYASGDYHGTNDTLEIYRSTDGGNSWSLFYSEQVPNSDGVLTMHMYQGKLFIFTLTNGVLMLDPALVSSPTIDPEKNEVTLFPNPAASDIHCTSVQTIQKIIVTDIFGNTVIEQFPESKTFYVDFSELSSGVYFFQLQSEYGITTEKVTKL